jgi:hypothetical protein
LEVEARLGSVKWLVLSGLSVKTWEEILSGLGVEAEIILSDLALAVEAVRADLVPEVEAVPVVVVREVDAVLVDSLLAEEEEGWLSPKFKVTWVTTGVRLAGALSLADVELATKEGNCQSSMGAKCCCPGEDEGESACANAG